MKKQSSRAKARSVPPVRHQLEHAVPTVIHNPEENMTALGRVASHAIKEPRRYLGWPAVAAGVTLLVVIVWRLTSGGSSVDSTAWSRLELAMTPTDRLAVAKADPGSPAAHWALLQVASKYCDDAMLDLPNNQDVSRQTSRKALDLYDQIIREAPHDSSPARLAALGRARVLEMRNDLPDAIKQYEKVAKDWPDSPEAAEAKRYAEALKDPQAANFYKELYAFRPTTVTLPPEGTTTQTFPSTGVNPDKVVSPPSLAPTPGKSVLTPDMPIPGVREVVVPSSTFPVKPETPETKTPAATEPKPAPAKTENPKPAASSSPAAKSEAPKAEAPKPAPPKAEAPKPAPPKAEAPKPAPAADQKKKELPADVFAPESKKTSK